MKVTLIYIVLVFVAITVLPASLLAAGPPYEIWNGPAYRGLDGVNNFYTTFLTIADSKLRTGASGTVEYYGNGRFLASQQFQVPPGGLVKKDAPPEAQNIVFLYRVISDQPVQLWSEARNTNSDVSVFTAPAFFGQNTMSPGDVAVIGGASARIKVMSARNNIGLMCLRGAACTADVTLTNESGVDIATNRIASGPYTVPIASITDLFPAALSLDPVSVRFTAVSGRFMPFIVRNDTLSSDGLLLATDIDRTNGSTFVFPMGCSLGKDCWVVSYNDRDSTSGLADYGGGKLTRDGHDGIDYIIRGLAEMDMGVDVFAVAAGVVLGAIDTNPDRCIVSNPCSTGANTINIRHADGSITNYLHLKKFSALVKAGQVVRRGQKIAEVGSAGQSTDPHLHFGWQRTGTGATSDPFAIPSDPYITQWESPSDYQGFDGLQVGRALFSTQTGGVVSWSVDPVPITLNFSRGSPVGMHFFLLRIPANTLIHVHVLDPNGNEVYTQNVTRDRDIAISYFLASFTLAANAAVGEYKVLLYEGTRLVTQRNFQVN